MNIFRRRTTSPTPRPATLPQTRALLIDGNQRTLAELRSGYNSGMRMLSRSAGIITGDYSPEDLGMAYKTGLTAFIGVNVRAGIDAEIPVHCVDMHDNQLDDSPAEAFIKNAPKWLWLLMAHSIIWGAIYIRKTYNKYGYPTGLEVLSPLDIEPQINYSTGVVTHYRVYRNSASIELVPASHMIVNLSFNPFSDVDGLSPLEVAKVRSDIETNIGRYGAMFFANSARPDLIVQTEEAMTDDELKKAKESYAASFKGVLNSFRAWFTAGDKYTITPISTNPVDLAMSELTNQADIKILAALRVSPVLAGIGTASDPLSAQSTYEQIRRQHVDFVAVPDVRQICNILNEQWLHRDFPDGANRWRLEPDIQAITSDALGTGERVVTANTAVTSHVWTVNESRTYTGKEPQRYAVNINPDWSMALYDKGLLTRRQALMAVGFTPETVTAPDGYIYELDPRFKGPSVAPQFGLPQGGYYPPLPTPPQRSIEPPLPAVVPVDTLTIEPAPPKRNAENMAALQELQLWAKRVRHHGTRTKFTTEILHPQIATFVRSNLDAGWSPASIFEAAKTWIRTGETQQIGAVPSEYTAYWHDYDGLRDDIKQEWLAQYMAPAWEALRPHLSADLTEAQILSVLAKHHDDLIAAWVGTPDSVGAITALALAGMVAGNRALQTGSAAKPTRAMTLVADWSVLSGEAFNFVQGYAFDLIKGIDQTTANLVRTAISDGLTAGLSIDEIGQQLTGVFGDADRARRIAANESLRAYNQGAFARWTNAGVTQAKWQTVNDSHVDPLCQRLNGQVADIGIGWRDPETGNIYRESAHPGCRCFRSPVL